MKLSIVVEGHFADSEIFHLNKEKSKTEVSDDNSSLDDFRWLSLRAENKSWDYFQSNAEDLVPSF